jgi:hypothetical protein
VVYDEETHQLRTCYCGCGLKFLASKRSRKIYFNLKHKDGAKAARKREAVKV